MSSLGSILKQYTKEEVAKHCTVTDCWIIIHGKVSRVFSFAKTELLLLTVILCFHQVYDVSKFLYVHPGGVSPLFGMAGKDATAEFEGFDIQYYNDCILKN